jgi:hypothetical protein
MGQVAVKQTRGQFATLLFSTTMNTLAHFHGIVANNLATTN